MTQRNNKVPPVRAWALEFLRGLDRVGVRTLWLAPGARSAPLAWAAAVWREQTRLRPEPFVVRTHFDERGLAFAALGEAQASGRPVACLTTSGSAVANLFPAVVEAFHAGTPLILLTADRPPEVRGRGANQTIAQPQLFGSFVLRSLDFPGPTAGVKASELARWITTALEPMKWPWSGPVHLNVPFREPLLPEETEPEMVDDIGIATAPERIVSIEAPCPWLGEMAGRRGFLVVGELSAAEQAGWAEIEALARTLGWPVVASPLAGGPAESAHRVRHFAVLLQRPEFAWPAEAPEVICHLGGAMVARRLGEFLGRFRGANYLQIRRGPPVLDPLSQNPQVLLECPIAWAQRQRTNWSELPSPAIKSWAAAWIQAGAALEEGLGEVLDRAAAWSEPRWARWVGHWAAAAGADLFLGNSMPVRDFESWARSAGCGRVFGQRGASGIDGNLAHVAGWARGSGRRVFALVGDLAVLHDLNSLTLLRGLPVTLFVPNNGGGGIFRFLPLALADSVRKEFFETPHGLAFKEVCEALGVAYHRVTAGEPPTEIFQWVQSQKGAALVEYPSDRAENQTWHQRLQAWASGC